MRSIYHIAIALTFLLSACQDNMLKDSKPRSSQISIEIEPLSGEKWSVKIQSPEPVEALGFLRNTGSHRPEQWAFSNEDLDLKRRNNVDVIYSKSGKKIQSVEALVSPFRGPISKEYLLFGAFSNGAERVYMGQFRVHPTDLDGTFEPSERISEIQVTPGHFKTIFADGKWRDKRYTMTGTTDETDTYAVFGNVPVSEFSGGSLIVDPGLPDELRSKITDVMTLSAAYFNAKLGAADGPNRLTLISFMPDEQMQGTSIEGGVLSNQIHFHLTGSGWDKADGTLGLELAWVAAHEVAHVWNAFGAAKPDYFTIRPEDESSDIMDAQWLHEGGADMLTYKAVLKNDLATPEFLNQKTSGFYRQCGAALGRGPLNLAAKEGRFRDYYDCGFVIGLLTDLACRPDELDYIDIWKSMISSSQDGLYGQDLYLESLGQCSGGMKARDTINEMTLGLVEQPELFLQKAFAEQGVAVTIAADNIEFDPPI